MPGKRNLARERAQHAATEHERSAALYTMLCQALPDREQAIIGHARILHHLASLHVTRRNGRPLSWRIVTRWRRLHAFPLLSGAYRPHHLAPPFSTTHAITAWLLTRLSSDEHELFRVGQPSRVEPEGNAPRDSRSAERTLADAA